MARQVIFAIFISEPTIFCFHLIFYAIILFRSLTA